jgi:hypothetical protein
MQAFIKAKLKNETLCVLLPSKDHARTGVRVQAGCRVSARMLQEHPRVERGDPLADSRRINQNTSRGNAACGRRCRRVEPPRSDPRRTWTNSVYAAVVRLCRNGGALRCRHSACARHVRASCVRESVSVNTTKREVRALAFHAREVCTRNSKSSRRGSVHCVA